MEFEEELCQALIESEQWDGFRKKWMIEMQAMSVLQNIYVKEVRNHLEEVEMHTKQKQTRNWPLGNGMPKLMTVDTFYNKVVSNNEAAKQEEEEKH